MIEKFVAFSAWIQAKTEDIPYISLLSVIPKDVFQYFLLGTAAFLLLLFILLLIGGGKGMKKRM